MLHFIAYHRRSNVSSSISMMNITSINSTGMQCLHQQPLRINHKSSDALNASKDNSCHQNSQKHSYTPSFSINLRSSDNRNKLFVSGFKEIHEHLGNGTASQMKRFISEAHRKYPSYICVIDNIVKKCSGTLATPPPSRLVRTASVAPKNIRRICLLMLYTSEKSQSCAEQTTLKNGLKQTSFKQVLCKTRMTFWNASSCNAMVCQRSFDNDKS